MRRFVLALALCVALPAVAQMRVCMGGHLDHMSAAQQRACSDRVQVAQSANYGKASQDWHLVVVCDEDAWKDYIAFSGHAESELALASTDTDASTRTIFLRGSRMTSPAAVSEAVAKSIVSSPDEIELAAK